MARNRDRTGPFTPFLVGAALLTLPLAACGPDSPTEPVQAQGTVEAVVRDDPSAAAGPPLSPSRIFTSGEFEATARVQVQVDGEWRDLEGMSGVDFHAELQGGEEAMGSAVVEARTYDRARVVLTGARTHLNSEVGVGPIDASLTLSIAEGEELVVESTQPLMVGADGTTRLVLDLNSHLWIDDAAVNQRAVTRSSFEGAATVAVQ